MIRTSVKLAGCAAVAVVATVAAAPSIEACTRAVYLGSDGLVITGRNMDWVEDMSSNLWVFPRGMQRDGAAGPNSVKWTAKYGSATVAGYDKASTDGMNEKGLVANLLYLADSDFGKPGNKPTLSVTSWAQYVLDNFATVAEAVDALGKELDSRWWRRSCRTAIPPSFTCRSRIPRATRPCSSTSAASSSIHHGKQYQVMTNEPPMDQQAALNGLLEDDRRSDIPPGYHQAGRPLRARQLLHQCPSEDGRAGTDRYGGAGCRPTRIRPSPA